MQGDGLIPSSSFQKAFCDALAAFWDEVQEQFPSDTFAERLFHDLTEFTQRPGKRIRPWLFAEFYRLLGRENWAEAGVMRAALALELLHSFILVHDDIIDRSVERRGRLSLHRLLALHFGKHKESLRLGESLAIVGGDILFALAYKALLTSAFRPDLKVKALLYLSSAILDTGCGEVLEIYTAARDLEAASMDIIQKIYELKTTRYTFIAPLRLAGILAEADETLISKLEQTLLPLGLLFQIANDLDDFRRMRNELDSTDLSEGIKTILLRTAYDRLGEVERTLLQLCLSDATYHEGSFFRIVTLIEKSGALGEIKRQKERLLSECIRRLEMLNDPDMQSRVYAIISRIGVELSGVLVRGDGSRG
ncbi:MAG: polyprenyl synthetase family protein [Methylacidiphilales bacterium]|nr:polyprenyl synthetase family protein [Candidatus Methylacidiphilales bacterium]MDW8348805.1 polyprenyl synthetase family protein [Verrucomicrobiae bacterium]